MKVSEENIYTQEKKIRINKEKENLEKKYNIEYVQFNDKITSIFNEFKSNRILEYDKIIQKHKCVLKEIEATQKLELSNTDKIVKGISSKDFINKFISHLNIIFFLFFY
jgi:hypothetical protein